ncbi:MAG: nucleotidyltransferase domain-containing protein [Candidatus Micrarchaeia archaeon]
MGRRGFVTVLRFFLENPSLEAHAAELKRRLEVSKNSLLDALRQLEQTGLLRKKAYGRALYYSFDRSDVLGKELRKLLTLSALRERLRERELEGIEVFLYGSAARGENTEASDIDILAVGPQEKRTSSELNRALEGMKTKLLYLTPLEYSELARKDRALYDSIERDKVRLV